MTTMNSPTTTETTTMPYTECDEVACNMAEGYSAWLSLTHGSTMKLAREYVQTRLPNESHQVIDNVAQALHERRTK